MKSKKFKQSPFVESVAIRAKYFPKNIPAVVYGDEIINWKTLFDRICRVANYLNDYAKVQKGDKVAFIFFNTPQFLEINFAIQMLGAVPTPINYRYVGSEIEYTVNDCDAVALLCEEDIVNEVVEIKNIGINKGKAAMRWLSQKPWDFIIAFGDDWTDEDTFRALPEGAYSVKVGISSTAAKYNIKSVTEVRNLLKEFAKETHS